jgi:hypothetical protein
MKRLLTVSVLLMSAMVSCKKDTPLNEAIIGQWDVISIQQVTYKDDVKKGESTAFLTAGEMSIQFAQGGTGIYYEDGDVYGIFNWTISGNTLTIPGDTPTVWDITIDKNTLIWSYSETEVTDSGTYKYEYFYTAQKKN